MIVREAHQRRCHERRDGRREFEDQTARQLPDLEGVQGRAKRREEAREGQDGKRSKKAGCLRATLTPLRLDLIK